MKTNYKWFHLIVFSESVSLTMRTVYFDLWESSRCRGLERKLRVFFWLAFPLALSGGWAAVRRTAERNQCSRTFFLNAVWWWKFAREIGVNCESVTSQFAARKKRRFRESSAREFVFFFRFAWGGDLARGSHVRDSVFYFYIFTVICFISFRLWNHPEEYSRV